MDLTAAVLICVSIESCEVVVSKNDPRLICISSKLDELKNNKVKHFSASAGQSGTDELQQRADSNTV